MARKLTSSELANQLIDLVAARASFLENPGAMYGAPLFTAASFAIAARMDEATFVERARTLYGLAAKSKAEHDRQRIVRPGELSVLARVPQEQTRHLS